MKKILFFITLLLFTKSIAQEKISAQFDERVELLSIVFRLAGNPEYNSNLYNSYVAHINSYYEKHKNHPCIIYAKHIREENGISYDAVMSMAVHLTKPPKISLIKEKKSSLDKRWNKIDKKKFLALLNSFYLDSNSESFFNNHQNINNESILSFNSILTDFDQNWYSKYYGKEPVELYNIILCFGNGSGNYGAKCNPEKNKNEIFAFMGVWKFDKETGRPIFNKENYLSTLIHEYNHSFINYILDVRSNHKEIKNSGELIYNKLKTEMDKQAYKNWETVINESLVRASVVRYLIDHNADKKTIDKEIIDQVNRGFYWTKELSNLLGEYENNRKEYPSFESFYPKIIDFFNKTAKNIDTLKTNFENNQPKVASINVFNNNAQSVDSSIQEIVITFDKELDGKGVSINFSEKGKEFFPLKKFGGFINNNKSIKLQVELKPNSEYEFILSGNSFKSIDGYSLKEYIVKFKTK